MKKLSKWQLVTLRALNSLCEEDTEKYFDVYSVMAAVNLLNGGHLCSGRDITNAIRALERLDLLSSVFDPWQPVRYRLNENGIALAKEVNE